MDHGITPVCTNDNSIHSTRLSSVLLQTIMCTTARRSDYCSNLVLRSFNGDRVQDKRRGECVLILVA